MRSEKLQAKNKGWSSSSPSSDGDDLNFAFGKIQPADSADMRRMGKKQEFRVCIMTLERT